MTESENNKPIPTPEPTLKQLKMAAENADWMQVALNHRYGAPCFHFEEHRGSFCLRAKSWFGHDGDPHEYVSLAELIGEIYERP